MSRLRRTIGLLIIKARRAFPALAVGVACAGAATAMGDDWPQWQGPDRNAMSEESGLLQEWTPDGPPLAWKAEGLGGGHSTPSVAAGRIYGMSHRGEDEIAWALSEPDGRALWTTRLGLAFAQSMPQGKEGPAATPTVDGERLEEGHILLIEPSAEQYLERGRFEQPGRSDKPAWAHPVIANGRLYVRDQDLLLAYDIVAKRAPTLAGIADTR